MSAGDAFRERRRPDFVGIGAIKSGTTWLHRQLVAHPGAWLPPVKELRYFDEPETELRARLLGAFARDAEERRRHQYWRHELRRALGRPAGWLPRSRPLWHLRYFFGRRGDRWYRALFRPAGERVSGEVTPLYAPMPEARIAALARALPEVRVIYLLRDPVERTWSHVLLRCLGLVGWCPERLTLDLVRETVERRELADPWLFRNGRYAETLARWERHVDPERIFVGFYDDLRDRPAELLARIEAFLGLAPAAPDPGRLAERANPRPVPLDLPADLAARFAARFLDDLALLEARFGEPVTGWRERAERSVGAAPPG